MGVGWSLARGEEAPPTEAGEQGLLASWWEAPRALPRWELAEQHGVEVRGFYRGTLYGILSGGVRRGTILDEEVRLGLNLDLAKLVGWDGWRLTGSVRWRDGANPSDYVGTFSPFSPSPWQSGKGWRLMPFYASWQSETGSILLRGGYINPYEFFLQMPLTTAFVNSAFSASKGISGAGVPWSSSYASWGGFVQVRPTKHWWVRASLSAAIPGQAATANHGLNFALTPSSGLYAVAETEWTLPIWRDSAGVILPGRVGAGGYLFGVERYSFDASGASSPWGGYFFAEQMLWRPREDVREVPPDKLPSTRGLHGFFMFNASPPDFANLPIFFNTGLVYEGLLPGRGRDLLAVGFAWGEYSWESAKVQRLLGRRPESYEAVLEADYRVALAKWGYVQPFCQFILNPSGRGTIPNCFLIGLNFRAEL